MHWLPPQVQHCHKWHVVPAYGLRTCALDAPTRSSMLLMERLCARAALAARCLAELARRGAEGMRDMLPISTCLRAGAELACSRWARKTASAAPVAPHGHLCSGRKLQGCCTRSRSTSNCSSQQPRDTSDCTPSCMQRMMRLSCMMGAGEERSLPVLDFHGKLQVVTRGSITWRHFHCILWACCKTGFQGLPSRIGTNNTMARQMQRSAWDPGTGWKAWILGLENIAGRSR